MARIKKITKKTGEVMMIDNPLDFPVPEEIELSEEPIVKASILTPNDYVGTTCEKWKGKVDFDYWSFSDKAFQQGRALFCMTFPHVLKSYSANCVDDYGILPFGKYDEDQEKY